MRRSLRIFRDFLSLISFLTILPTGGVRRLDMGAEGFFMVPLVGVIVGFISGTPELLPRVNPLIRGVLITSLLYTLSGLIHLDGFADFIDASSAGVAGDKALKILKEPWRGAKAVGATALIILLTFSGLSEFPPGYVGEFLVTAITLVNYEALFITAAIARPSPYEGLGRLFITHSSKKSLRAWNALLTVALLIPLVLYGGVKVITAILASFSITALVIWYSLLRAYKVLGFINGDILGYVLELSRSISYPAVALVLGLQL